jgi:hypothetical protein
MNRNPYAAPNAPVTDASRTPGPNAEFSKWVRWALYLQIAILIGAVISGFVERENLSASDGSNESQLNVNAGNDWSDLTQGIVGVAQILIAVTSGVLILIWIYRANVQARRMGALGMKFTPGWSVGWYFIPFANLWKPYQAMREIWLASANPENWNNELRLAILPWWWTVWIVSNFASNASFRLTLRAESLNQLVAANTATLISDSIDIPLCVLFLVIISRIDAMQSTRIYDTDEDN